MARPMRAPAFTAKPSPRPPPPATAPSWPLRPPNMPPCFGLAAGAPAPVHHAPQVGTMPWCSRAGLQLAIGERAWFNRGCGPAGCAPGQHWQQ